MTELTNAPVTKEVAAEFKAMVEKGTRDELYLLVGYSLEALYKKGEYSTIHILSRIAENFLQRYVDDAIKKL